MEGSLINVSVDVMIRMNISRSPLIAHWSKRVNQGQSEQKEINFDNIKTVSLIGYTQRLIYLSGYVKEMMIKMVQ